MTIWKGADGIADVAEIERRLTVGHDGTAFLSQNVAAGVQLESDSSPGSPGHDERDVFDPNAFGIKNQAAAPEVEGAVRVPEAPTQHPDPDQETRLAVTQPSPEVFRSA